MIEGKWIVTCPACEVKGKFHDMNEFAKIIGDKQVLVVCSHCGTHGIFELKTIHGLGLPPTWEVKELPQYVGEFNEKVAPTLCSSASEWSQPYPLSAFQFDLATYPTGDDILIYALLQVFPTTTPLEKFIVYPFSTGMVGPGTPDMEVNVLYFKPSTTVGALVKTRLLPAMKRRFDYICMEKDIRVSEGVRQAIVEWMQAH